MFCEKCGTFLENDTKFCVNCGTKVNLPPAPQPVAEQPVAPAPTPAPAPAPQPVAAPVTQVFPKQEKPKKEKKKLTKKAVTGIIIGAVALVLAAVIAIAACIVLPIINAVKIDKYITLELSEEALVNGYLQGYVIVDIDQIRKDEDPDIDKDDYYEEVGEALSFCELEVSVNDTKLEGSLGEIEGLYDLSKDDVITVKIFWPDDEDDLEEIEDCEDELGFKFNKEETKVELKVSESIKEQKLDVIEPIDFDFFESFKSAITETGCKDGEIKIQVADIEETEIDGTDYTFEYDEYYEKVTIYDLDDYEVGSLDLSFGVGGETYYSSIGSYTFSKGDEIEFELSFDYDYYDEYEYDSEPARVGETNIFLKELSYTHTVVGNEALTLEDATKNATEVKQDLLAAAIAADYSDADYMQSVHKAFYLTPESEGYENVLFIVIKCVQDGETYFVPSVFYNVYYDADDVVYYSDYDEWYGYDTYKDAYERIESNFDKTYYTYTEIK